MEALESIQRQIGRLKDEIMDLLRQDRQASQRHIQTSVQESEARTCKMVEAIKQTMFDIFNETIGNYRKPAEQQQDIMTLQHEVDRLRLKLKEMN